MICTAPFPPRHSRDNLPTLNPVKPTSHPVRTLRHSRVTHFVRRTILLVATALVATFPTTPSFATDGDELLGRKAPEFRVTHWLNSPPLTMKALAGKVVLVRWWTAPHCQFCAATAPALNEFHDSFGEQGLQVIGLYHHKAPGPLDPSAVPEFVRKFGFKFPVAIDPEWRTLNAWWLQKDKRRWTSVTFLLDRTGTIRHRHPGGQYVKGDAAYRELRTQIEKLLAEK